MFGATEFIVMGIGAVCALGSGVAAGLYVVQQSKKERRDSGNPQHAH